MQENASMNRNASLRARLATAAGAFLVSGAAFAAQPLLLGPAQVQAESARAAGALAARPASTSVRALRADPNAVAAQNSEIGLDLGLKNVTAVLEKTTANPDGSLTWIGHVRETSKARNMTAREVRHDGNN